MWASALVQCSAELRQSIIADACLRSTGEIMQTYSTHVPESLLRKEEDRVQEPIIALTTAGVCSDPPSPCPPSPRPPPVPWAPGPAGRPPARVHLSGKAPCLRGHVAQQSAHVPCSLAEWCRAGVSVWAALGSPLLGRCAAGPLVVLHLCLRQQ